MLSGVARPAARAPANRARSLAARAVPGQRRGFPRAPRRARVSPGRPRHPDHDVKIPGVTLRIMAAEYRKDQ